MQSTLPAPSSDRRERKKAATRQGLQQAALTLAGKHGAAAVTVEAICDAVDVCPRTFFNYFSGKDEALAGDPLALDEQLRTALADAPADTPLRTTMRVALLHTADEAAQRRAELLLRRQLVRDYPALAPRMIATFAAREQALAQLIAAATGTDAEHDIYPALVAGLAGTVLRVAFQHWDGADVEQLHASIDEALDLIEQSW